LAAFDDDTPFQNGTGMIRSRKSRQGVVLLITLSILTLFALLAVTFVISSGVFKTAAVTNARVGTVGDPPEVELNQALMQVIRGPSLNATHVLAFQDLLSDLHGGDGFAATVVSAASVGSGQFVQINYTVETGNTAKATQGYYNGSVVTAVSGAAAMSSSRIVDYQPGVIIAEGFQFTSGGASLPQAGDRLVVNGKYFNGTGAGYNTATGNLDLMAPNGSAVALLPNFSRYNAGAFAVGGMDESYDAPDYQNMWLAGVQPGHTNSSQIIPSFHRPSLVNYWYDDVDGGTVDLRHFVMRPTQLDHPNFTGSNPAMSFTAASLAGDITPLLDALIAGPWDVDNDGNGVMDSVWLDLGFPVKTSSDGRSYKPLFAVLIKDLDNRLNINAHGNITHVAGGYDAPIAGPYAGAQANVPWSSGYGPADINFAAVAGTTTMITSRYGADTVPGGPGTGTPVVDAVSAIKEWGLPLTYGGAAVNSLGYGTPPNTFGRNPFAIDHFGQPAFRLVNEVSRTNDPYEFNFSQPTHRNQVDQPFTAAEVERLLRYYDGDASTLANRILELDPALVGNTTVQERLRDLITTESRHVPAPNSAPLPFMRGNGQDIDVSIMDIFRARLQQGGFAGNVDTEIRKMVAFELLHGEMMDINRWFGNGFDDNGNNVVDEPTEVNNTTTPNIRRAFANLEAPDSFNAATFDHANGSVLAPQYGQSTSTAFPVDSRQIFARHLYCLAMAMLDPTHLLPPGDAAITADATLNREMVARRVAQWAVNVVDFRDSDAIMTAFEYDVNPFDDDGWSVDGNLHTHVGTGETDARLVFGAEHPDLIITETFATHDRRVRDTAFDSGDGEKRIDTNNPMEEGDNDLDQYRIPQGSLFMELMATRSIAAYNSPRVPTELYDPNTRQLDLERVDGNGNPVWRVVIAEGNVDATGNSNVNAADLRISNRFYTTRMDPFDMNYNDRTLPVNGGPDQLDVDRVIWFSHNAPNPATSPHADRTYYNHGAVASAHVQPGQYVVVGPRQVTHFGSRATSPETTSLQRIELNPGGVTRTDMTGVALTNNQAKGIVVAALPPDPTIANGWTAANLATTANLGPNYSPGIGISVSEPLPQSGAYYREPIGNSLVGTFDAYDEFDAATGAATNNSLPDEPFDNSAPYNTGPLEGNTITRTIPKFKTGFLQRVADPMLAWNPLPGDPMYDNTRPINPYITVDWSSIDLSVYNGEDRVPAGWDDNTMVKKLNAAMGDPPAPIGSWDPGDPPASDPALDSDVRFRSREAGDSGSANNPYAPSYSVPPVTAEVATDAYFRHPLVSTFGGLNSMFTLLTPADPAYPQAPSRPFISLAWLDRPYTNPMELLTVPISGPSRLTTDMSALNTGVSPYTTPASANSLAAPHQHLPNFFTDEYAQLFDYLGVQSPYVGTEIWYNPNNAPTSNHSAPYNRLSRFRDPGRVNINTVLDIPQLNLLLGDSTGTLAAQVIASRRGYAGASWNTLDPNADYPSRFSNPFRSAAGASLMPPVKPGSDSNASKLVKRGVDGTLLRQFTPAGGSVPIPLLADKSIAAAATDGTDHAHFFYNNYKTTGSNFTTHSNVFAVWITVGYFEVEPNPGGFDAAHPDGYRLSQEIGADYGDVRRHRGFYIIDRSIPVAFEPGQDHNVDKTILLRRFIE
jgi:hypothetical protein